MKKFYTILAILSLLTWLSGGKAFAAAGGADYGRGPETDPVAMATGAITTTNIADGTIGNADMQASSITTTNIVNGTIGNADLAGDAAIGLGKLAVGLAAGTNGSSNLLIQYGSVTTTENTTLTNTFTQAYPGGVTPVVLFGADNVGGTNTLASASNVFTVAYGMTNVTTRWVSVGITGAR